MKHSQHPAAIYDLAVVASTIARYNSRNSSAELDEQLNGIHQEALELLRLGVDKPVLAHADERCVLLALDFTDRIMAMLSIAEQNSSIQPTIANETKVILIGLRDRIQNILSCTDKSQHFIDPSELASTYGLNVMDTNIDNIIDDELKKWEQYTPYETPNALLDPVTLSEAKNIYTVTRDRLFSLPKLDPTIYIEDNRSKHHLLWSAVSSQQEFAVPFDYGMDTYLRFDCPHSHVHLAHLYGLQKFKSEAYVDYMDERAFFEAIAVYAEREFFKLLTQNPQEVAANIHEAFSEERAQAINIEDLSTWLIASRGYEFRLRAVRLVADILTMRDKMNHSDMIAAATTITGLDSTVVTEESDLYYYLTGLGAMYTLGYRKLEEEGSPSINDLVTGIGNGEPNRTWFQHSSNA